MAVNSACQPGVGTIAWQKNGYGGCGARPPAAACAAGVGAMPAPSTASRPIAATRRKNRFKAFIVVPSLSSASQAPDASLYPSLTIILVPAGEYFAQQRMAIDRIG